jgi:hypothetical protein
VQESFGLTPLEAMASGLPSVLSGWNGYKETVRHGMDGFHVTTTQPGPGYGKDLAALILTGREIYSGFTAKTAQFTAVDHESAAAAIALLIQDETKRAQMGQLARQRAQETYDWRVVISQYEKFWREMGEKARRDTSSALPATWPAVHPQLGDPFSLYRHFPTSTLCDGDRFELIAGPDEIRDLCQHTINIYAPEFMLPMGDLATLLNIIGKSPKISLAEVCTGLAQLERAALMRTVAWLLKIGALRRYAA